MQTQVEELPENRVRLTVDVPNADVRHAIEHAASDLAGSLRIPGFRKGKVPVPVLIARIGKERLYEEAVTSHIGSWFMNAAATAKRPSILPAHARWRICCLNGEPIRMHGISTTTVHRRNGC